MGGAVEIRLLGPVEVIGRDGPLNAGPPQRRAVLAAFAVEAGRVVTQQTLIDRVWGETPPRRVRSAVHANVALIRRLLNAAGTGSGQAPTLTRRAGGYVLEIDPESVDLHHFSRLVIEARRRDDEDERATLLREALDLWHGPALMGLSGEWPERMRGDWDRQRLDAHVEWAQAELRLARHHQVISSIRPLVNENCFVEPLVAVLMRALAAGGRIAEALDCYATSRTRLADELGIDPGPQLQALHQAILQGSLGPDPAPPDANPTAVSPAIISSVSAITKPVPAQVPAGSTSFTGRAEQLQALDRLLDHPDDVRRQAVVIAVVSGVAGVGKTALAIHWAHRVAGQFPDGQLYVDLRGFDPTGSPVDPAQAVRGLLEALDTAPQRIPTDVTSQTALYRSLIAGRRMLIVFDNARDAAQIRPLLPGAAGCVVVVTSRHRLPGLIAGYGARCITLEPLSPIEARQMLDQRLGADRAGREPGAVNDIVGSCGRLPLALAVVAANAATHPQLPLASFAAQLRQTHRRLDALSTGDLTTDLRTVISCSYHALAPEAAQLFRLLGLHPGPDVDSSAAAALVGAPAARVEVSLSELARVNLLIEQGAHRYAMHDLLRLYALEQTHSIDTQEQRAAATYRMLDHYLYLAAAADQRIQPTRATILPPAPAGRVPPFIEYHQAMQWLVDERFVLMSVVEYAAHHGFHDHAWQLAWALTTMLNRKGHWHDWVTVHRTALEAIRGRADDTVQATVHFELARAYLHIDDEAQAGFHLQQAREIFDRQADDIGMARTHGLLALMSSRQRDFIAAIEHTKAALLLYQTNQHLPGQAQALNNLGWYHGQLDEHQLAIPYCMRAIALNYRIGQRNNQAAAWDSLGYIYDRLGKQRKAIACYERALHLWQDLDNQYEYAITQIHLGDARQAAGELDLAETAWWQGLATLEKINHHDTPDVRQHIYDARRQPTPRQNPEPVEQIEARQCDAI